MGARVNEEAQMEIRPILASAKELMNAVLVDIAFYLNSISKQFDLKPKDISNSLFEMKSYFPDASCMLMLFLLDCLSPLLHLVAFSFLRYVLCRDS